MTQMSPGAPRRRLFDGVRAGARQGIEDLNRALSMPKDHRVLWVCGLLAWVILGAGALSAALVRLPGRARSPAAVILVSEPAAASPRVLATSITPITSLAGAASGFAYSGASYIVNCTVTGEVTLYPVVHNGSAWEGPLESYGCPLSDTITSKGSCWFPARVGTDLTWNAFKTGAGTVASCTATASSLPVPSSRAIPSSGPGSGTVTSIDCGTGLTCTPDPIVATGTIVPTFGTAVGQVAQGGVVAAATCASPSSLTYNAAGQVTSCTAGSGSSGGGNSIYGDGSDGAGSIAGGTTTLARDAYYDTLTVSATGILNAAGFRIFCKTSLTVESGGYIHNNGTDASGGMGGTGGTALTLGGGANGAIGGTFGGSNGTGLSNALGGAGGNGGAGNGGGMAAGTGGTITAPAANGGSFRTMPFAMFGATVSVVGTANPTWIAVQGGAGGASGGGDGANSSGGGGGGGGVLVVVAKAMTLAGTGAIRSNGGAGGTSAGGNAGGGGGGGGGLVYAVYNTKSGVGTITASGGAAGAGAGTGANGVAGSSGTVIELVN